MLFAWKVCKHVKSNAIVYADEGPHRRVGAGQMSRVDSAKNRGDEGAAPDEGNRRRLRRLLPVPGRPRRGCRGGATAVIQPGGSVRDAEVIAAADEHGMAMVFTGCGTSGI